MSSAQPYQSEIPIDSIILSDKNPRDISDRSIEQLCEDIKNDPSFLIQRPPLINKVENKHYCYAGSQRVKAAKKMGKKGLHCFIEADVPEEVQNRRMIIDNTHRGEWNYDLLVENFDYNLEELKELGVPDFEIGLEEAESEEEKKRQESAKSSLQENFGAPPFSILDTRKGYWQDRKKHWEDLGVKSQASREEVEIMARSAQNPEIYNLRNKLREKLKREPSWEEITQQAELRGMKLFSGASIFDPVLTETLYHWFTKKGMSVLDPFAGGSVRGIVAGMMERGYHGIDLRPDQVAANQKQADNITPPVVPYWYTGDGLDQEELLPQGKSFDFVFSCPPYHDLEQYSEDKKDLSNMGYEDFLETYRTIIQKSVDNLKDNRFACFVVSEVREKKDGGFYKGFVQDTIEAFEKAGAKFYNEIILINQVASLAIRAGRQFQRSRKVGRMHQNVLVFYKGDPKKIKDEFGEINLGESLEEPELST